MTDKELRQFKNGLNQIRETVGSETIKKLDTICDCIDMINSILAYSIDYKKDANELLDKELNSWHSYLSKYVEKLGKDIVLNLIKGQQSSIKEIKKCVYTDYEGVTYNSIIWAE